MKHKKDSKKAKHRKKEKDKKKRRKERRDSTSSTSGNSTDNEKQVWVEKKISQASSLQESSLSTSKEETSMKREEWMSLNSLFPCTSNIEKEKREKAQKDVNRTILDTPGQNARELNPYWKNGGTGLPEENTDKSTTQNIMDVNWLKKSLQRAQEQAASEGRALEDIAAERWGSLEAIHSMIATAERTSSNYKPSQARNAWENNRRFKYDKRYDDDTKYSRKSRNSRSRSKSREKTRRYEKTNNYELNRSYKKSYKKPTDDGDDYSSYTSRKTQCSSGNKNWRKETADVKIHKVIEKPCASELEGTALHSDTPAIIEVKASKLSPEKVDKVFTEADMNKLGAKIVKAEIMGDAALAVELKAQLEQARKHCVKDSALRDNQEVENVILTRTDARGVTRPVEPRTQTREPPASSKKRKNVQTHVSGERVRHYFDDDKYSLQQIFQREKGRSGNEDDAVFTKLASKSMDINDLFEEQITRSESDAKRDEKDRMHAIKEHQRMTKSLDNCRWCMDSSHMLKHMIVAMNSRVCLSLPSVASLTEGHCVLSPVQHTACQLQLDEDVWQSLKTFQQALCKMFVAEGQYPVFFEVYKGRHKFPHMQLECVPLPNDVGHSAPMYFKKALLECEMEWSINKKVIDLKEKDVRHAVPNGLSYFMVQFGKEGGYAHVIEDEQMFPKNFAEEIIGGMLDLDHDLWRKPRRQNFEEQREKVVKFTSVWKKYDLETQNDSK